jgi:hypothetical protein
VGGLRLRILSIQVQLMFLKGLLYFTSFLVLTSSIVEPLATGVASFGGAQLAHLPQRLPHLSIPCLLASN